jgi:ubiquinone/menaquinone biosynthesis C-methylase UbiE
MNRTELPFWTVSEDRLDFDTDSFDYVLLCYVLHHAKTPDRVLQEAVRVSRRGVIVLESLYHNEFQHQLLRILDRAVNRVRSRGLMRSQEEHLHHRTKEEWMTLLDDLGLQLLRERSDGHWIHRKAVLMVCE